MRKIIIIAGMLVCGLTLTAQVVFTSITVKPSSFTNRNDITITFSNAIPGLEGSVFVLSKRDGNRSGTCCAVQHYKYDPHEVLPD